MSKLSYSDEPQFIKPSGPNYRLWLTFAAIAAVLLVLAAVLALPMYNNWQDEQAHNAERGMFGGTVHRIEVGGQTYRMEFGWLGDRMGVVLRLPNPETVKVHVSGKFGSETLEWNPEARVYGPTKAQVDPFKHYKVDVTIESADGSTLWTGKEWAWGIHVHSHSH